MSVPWGVASMARIMHLARRLRRRPTHRAAATAVAAAVLIHLAMLVAGPYEPAHAGTADAIHSAGLVAHTESGLQAVGPPAQDDSTPVVDLMLHLCLAVLVAGFLGAVGAGSNVRVGRVIVRTTGHAERPWTLRPPRCGPGRSRVDTGLVLRV